MTQGPNLGTAPPTGQISKPDLPMVARMPAAMILSPEAMIAYVSTQLKDADGAIFEKMTSLNTMKEEAALLSKIAAELGTCIGENTDKQIAKLAELKELAKDFPQVLEKLEAYGKGLVGKSGKDADDGDDTWLKNQIGVFNAAANEVSGQTDLAMIELQSMVEKRSRVVAFASKVVASLNETVKETLNNIR